MYSVNITTTTNTGTQNDRWGLEMDGRFIFLHFFFFYQLYLDTLAFSGNFIVTGETDVEGVALAITSLILATKWHYQILVACQNTHFIQIYALHFIISSTQPITC